MPDKGMTGTTWSFSAALAHAERVELLDHARALHRTICGDDVPLPATPELPPAAEHAARRRARDMLLLALRDGYIRATGRLSTTPALLTASESQGRWRLHATDPSLITTGQWREGAFDFARQVLTGTTWEYIHIEMPDFMVRAIWPEPEPLPRPAGLPLESGYSTPYLDLMQAAIAYFQITAERQEKKESLVAWFLSQRIEGEPVSRNLAEAMATLIRLPAAQRGGAKRIGGPEFSRAS